MSNLAAPFPQEEMAARLARVRRAMVTDGIDALIVLAPDSQYWLCGLESFISGVLSQALIVPAADEREMALVVWDADAPLARATAIAEETYQGYRFGVDDPVEAFRVALAAHAPRAEVVGFDSASRAVPHTLGSALARTFPRAVRRQLRAACRRATARVRKRAGVPSPRRRIRASGFTRRPRTRGARITERRLAAEIEYAMRSAGSDYPSIPTELTSAPRSVLVHGTPSHRNLEAGDLVHVEVGGVEQRYNAVGLQTFHVGGAPAPPAGIQLYEVAQACLRAGLDAIRPDIEARAVEAPALAVLPRRRPRRQLPECIGYGVGAGYPPTWLDPFQITRTSVQKLQPGVAFVLHACLLDETSQVGVVVGGTYAMTQTGIEVLAGAGPVDLRTT